MRAISPDAMSVTCEEVAALLAPFVDGEFDEAEVAPIEAHLASCPSCARGARLQGAFKEALRRTGRCAAAPVGLRQSVLARLDEAEEDEGASAFATLPRLFKRFSPRALVLAAACGGLAAWVIAGGLQHPLLQADADRRAFAALSRGALEDGVALHAHTFPFDYAASDAGSVQRWLQGRLDFGVRLPRFGTRRGSPPALQGVRLSTLHARPAAMVSYTVPSVDGRRVSLLIVDDPEPQLSGAPRQVQGRQVWMAQARGYNVASWRSNEIVYSLISDLDEDSVLELVRGAELR